MHGFSFQQGLNAMYLQMGKTSLWSGLLILKLKKGTIQKSKPYHLTPQKKPFDMSRSLPKKLALFPIGILVVVMMEEHGFLSTKSKLNMKRNSLLLPKVKITFIPLFVVIMSACQSSVQPLVLSRFIVITIYWAVNGGWWETRTPDIFGVNEALYQLS